MKNIANRTVFLTGGANGIGRALAFRFATEKANLVLVDIDEKGLQGTAEEVKKTGVNVRTYICDLTVRENIYQLSKKVREEVGIIDILVNNAGVLYAGDFVDMTDAAIQRTIDINISAYAWVMKAFLPDIIKKGEGHVVNLASAAGLIGVPGLAVYSASKHAVIGLAESVRLECKKNNIKGINFTTVCPSYVNTTLVTGVRVPKMTPLLTPQKLADKIVRAIKKNKVFVREPFMVKITPLLVAITPVALFDRIGRLIGLYHTMDKWKGKQPGS